MKPATFCRELADLARQLAAVTAQRESDAGGGNSAELSRVPSAIFRRMLAKWFSLPAPPPAPAHLRSIFEQVDELLARADERVLLPSHEFSGSRWYAAASFCEHVLASYDRRERRARGVFFTPWPIVSFMVRSVEQLLRTRFGVDSLGASPRLRIVDPACGSGAFLLGVVEQLAVRPVGHSACELHGLELLPANCDAARLLLDSRLDVSSHLPRPQLRVVNPLLEPGTIDDLLRPVGDEPPLLVVLGNPPYASFGRQNRGPWLQRLLADYRRGLDERKPNVHDDYIKFFRWAQHAIDRAGEGILAFITNHAYLSGLTHRAMRKSLAASFSEMFLLDLHGSLLKQEQSPDGSPDENVFDIQPGVAIGLFVKRRESHGPAVVSHAELWGTREQKFATLLCSDVSTLEWRRLPLTATSLFVPQRPACSPDYAAWPRLDEIFLKHTSGVQTKKDELFVGRTRDEVAERMRRFLDPAARQRGEFAKLLGEGGEWLARRLSQYPELAFDDQRLRPYLVAPFDQRWIYYEPKLLGRARHAVMRHLLGDNLALVFMRQSTNAGEYDQFLVTDCLVSDRVLHSAHGAPFLAPLYLAADERREPNFEPAFFQEFSERRGAATSPEEVLAYLYAVFTSGTYRARYADDLRTGFPRLPWPGPESPFARLTQLGGELITLHTQLWSTASHSHFPCPEDIPDDVRNFRVGGCQVLQRWHKQRARQPLSEDERSYSQRLVGVLTATLDLQRQIDATLIDWLIR